MNMEVELCESLGFQQPTVRSYSKWCEEFNADNPGKDWDGSWALTKK